MPNRRPIRHSAEEERDAWLNILERRDVFEREMRAAGARGSVAAFIDAYKGGSVGCDTKTHEVVPSFSWHQLQRRAAQVIPGDGRRRDRRGEKSHFARHPRQGEFLAKFTGTRHGIVTFERKNWLELLKILKLECEKDATLGPTPSCPKQIRRFLTIYWEGNAAERRRLNGISKARSSDSPAFGRHRCAVTRPGEMVEIDFTPVDALSPDGGLYLVNAIDRFSAIASSLVVEAVNSDAVALIIYRFCTEHFIPETIVFDNGKESKNHRIRVAAKALDIKVRHTRPYRGDQKGSVERLNGRINNELVRLLNSHKGANVAERTAKRDRLDTYENRTQVEGGLRAIGKRKEELQKIVDMWFVGYHSTNNREMRCSPNECIANYQGTRPRKLGELDELAILQLLAPLAGKRGRATLRRRGFRIEGHDYTAPELGDPNYMGRTFEVREDILQPGHIHVFDVDPHDQTLRYVCLARADGITGHNPKDTAIAATKVWQRAQAQLTAKIRKNEDETGSIEEIRLGVIKEQARASNVVPLVRTYQVSPPGLAPFAEAVDASTSASSVAEMPTGSAESGTKLDRWLELDERVRAGNQLSGRDAAFYANYPNTPEFEMLMGAHTSTETRTRSA